MATTNYIAPAELARLVRKAKRARKACDELGTLFLRIAEGVWARFKFTPRREDFVSECSVNFLRALRSADPTKNLFNFFTKCAVRVGLVLRKKAERSAERFEAYRTHCLRRLRSEGYE